ncbi:MAG: MATE family efflux transporter [Candidatus Omnitrophica bacterium]|nr:MATE family efflux transporter [Candidatus Omnitrophota bacterium]
MPQSQSQPNRLTEGPIIRSLLILAFPLILSNLLQTAYQLTDTFWLGRLGADAVAAVSVSFPVIFLLASLGIGFTLAGTIIVSHLKGSNSQDEIDHASSQILFIVCIVALVISIIGYFITPVLINLLRTPSDVYRGAVAYLKISFIGFIFLFIYFTFQALLRGIGNVKTPLIIILGTVLLNLVLDPIFIFGYGPIPAFGVEGAAVTTLITQGLAGAIGIFILKSGRYGISLKMRSCKIDIPFLRTVLALAVPASIENSTIAVSLTAMIFLITGFGTIPLAAYGIGARILNFVFFPALALSMATSILVGQNIGAGKKDRAKRIARICAVFTFAALTLFGMIFFIFARGISTLFIPHNREVITASTVFIRILSLSFGFMGIHMVLRGAFRGAGNTKLAMIFTIIYLWGLRFPLAFILSRYTELKISGIWWAFPATNIITALCTIAVFAWGKWQKERIITFIERYPDA